MSYECDKDFCMIMNFTTKFEIVEAKENRIQMFFFDFIMINIFRETDFLMQDCELATLQEKKKNHIKLYCANE
jgi:hypothetical protein